ncbi:MAG: DNA repair protein RadC [Alphaproteobacteria bacterium]
MTGENDDREGHRERLRERFATGGGAALADYELLELLLFHAIPRRDTKPVAKELLRRFGSLAGVLAAEPAALREVKYVGDGAATLLKAVREAGQRLAREEVLDREVLSSWDQVVAYCRTRLAHETTERLHLLFLDRRNALIDDFVQPTGTVDQAPVYPREVVKRALDLGATAIIMVHNHPSGDPTPSQADIDITREVARAAAALGIELHDHVVVGRKGHVSLRAKGLL